MAPHTAVVLHQLLSFGSDFHAVHAFKIAVALYAGGLNVRGRQLRVFPMIGGTPVMFLTPFLLLIIVTGRMAGLNKVSGQTLAGVTRHATEFFRRMVFQEIPGV